MAKTVIIEQPLEETWRDGTPMICSVCGQPILRSQPRYATNSHSPKRRDASHYFCQGGIRFIRARSNGSHTIWKEVNMKGILTNRFWSKVHKTDGCWLWLGAKKGRGYGHMWIDGHMVAAHKIAWILTYGDIPLGKCVLHKCDNPACVNPVHLFLGTNSDNTSDMLIKNRHSYGEARYNSKLTAEDVRSIRLSSLTNAELARIYPVSFQQISKVRRHQEWKGVAV